MGIPVEQLNKIGEGSPHVVDCIRGGDVDLVINTPGGPRRAHGRLGDPPGRGRARHPLHHDDDRRVGRGARDRGASGARPRVRSLQELHRRPAAAAPRRADAPTRRRVRRRVSRPRTPAVEIEPGLAAPEQGPRVARAVRTAGLPRGGERGDRAPTAWSRSTTPAGPRRSPGQFYMLASAADLGREPAGGPYLARAFSVCRVARVAARVPARGDRPRHGAARGARRRVSRLWLVGPLGIGFSAPERRDGRAACWWAAASASRRS